MTAALDTGLASYTVNEVRTLLRFGRTTIYDGIENGTVPSIRLGSAVRVPGWWVRRMLRLNDDGSEPAAAA